MSSAKSSAHPQDLNWVRRIRSGDEAAWNRFVDHFSDRVWRRSWQLCYEACPHKNGKVHCVFHALADGGVKPSSDTRESCDDGLEIYAFTFDYFFNRAKKTGKLKHYDGRAKLDTFVSTVMHGHLRTDWIRHKRKLRVDQITIPEEVKRLEQQDHRVYEQMVMQRPTETIAQKTGLSFEETEQAQARVTHALMTNGNLHLILRDPEGAIDEHTLRTASSDMTPHVLPIKQSFEDIWDAICVLIGELPTHEQILLDLVFDQELNAKDVLARVETLALTLPVQPRTGNVTIHTIYQSVDAILRNLGAALTEQYPHLLRSATNWLERDANAAPTISEKGLKTLLKNMGIAPRSASTQPDQRAANTD